MSAPKVRLSNIDRGISVFTAVNSYQSRKLNEQILNQQYKNNNHLSALRSQMNEANAINKQILANQLKAEEHKEAQKYYKALSFNLFETIDLISKIEDKMVLNYVISRFYDKIKSNITEANDQLDEIVDKAYNKQSLDKLNSIKTIADEAKEKFKSNVLNKVDSLIADFRIKELKITSLNKPEFKEEIYKPKANGCFPFILGVIVIILLLICKSYFIGLVNVENYSRILWSVIAITSLIFLILMNREGGKGNKFKANQKLKKEEFEKQKPLIEKNYEESLLKEKEELLNHPLYTTMAEINENHPTFDRCLSDITELEDSFLKKWGLTEHVSSDRKAPAQNLDVFEKKIIELCSEGRKMKAIQYYMDENGSDISVAKDYVEKLVAKKGISKVKKVKWF